MGLSDIEDPTPCKCLRCNIWLGIYATAEVKDVDYSAFVDVAVRCQFWNVKWRTGFMRVTALCVGSTVLLIIVRVRLVHTLK